MYRFYIILSAFIFGIINFSFGQSDVEYYGKLMSIMQGNIGSNFELKNLQNKDHIYGLGAVENLKGEITIIDNKPFITSVENGKIKFDTTLNNNAALIVFGSVSDWQELQGTSNINTAADVENYLNMALLKNDSSSNEPIPFLIKGNVKSLSWHIIDWADGDMVHTHKKHKTSGLKGIIENQDVTIIGFYSQNHRGIITHRYSNIHMHFITEDKKISGHLDEVKFNKNVFIYTQKPTATKGCF